MQTNLESIFNKLQVNLFVARRDIESVRSRIDILELEDELFGKFIHVETAICEALETLKECRTELTEAQRTEYA